MLFTCAWELRLGGGCCRSGGGRKGSGAGLNSKGQRGGRSARIKAHTCYYGYGALGGVVYMGRGVGVGERSAEGSDRCKP